MNIKTIVVALILGAVVGVMWMAGGGRLLAEGIAIEQAPTVMNYQGSLRDANGHPINGTAALKFTLYASEEGGDPLWSEVQRDVPITDGNFAVKLGAISALGADQFAESNRYLQIGVDQTNTDSNYTVLPRQKLGAVPYAWQASRVSWLGLTDIPADFADGIDNIGGVNPAHLVIVDKGGGGDYTSISEAINAINPTSVDPYLVWVMPGVYNEQVVLKPYVHLQGAGVHQTIIRGEAFGDIHQSGSSMLVVSAESQVSHVSVVNLASNENSSAVFIDNGNQNTMLDNVRAIAVVPLGQRHVGVYMKSGQAVLRHVYAEAQGQVGAWAFFGNAASPLIEDSTFIAGGSDTANGLRLNGGAPTINRSEIRAKQGQVAYGIELTGGGNDTIHINHSIVEGEDFGIRISSGNHQVYVGAAQVIGGANAFGGFVRCAQSYNGDYIDINAACQ